ncbi:hypothetical protein IWQ56_004044 [Coemansia nantahalensis]|uniref:Uncharacterized protein n=2 Tax=Coemansia TaxID=4863 RepID=A0ACC1LFQ2_9FUNG|nr:hypothetical protein IWQ56_004044 [Coemansia nantahalensis]KAJ2771872.1 hypothetical protein IWQ57_002012 [Coemansia nantahalensis]KAJ2807106.1 hypothetical protein H4R21_000610 [Coemansia helicoidea]
MQISQYRKGKKISRLTSVFYGENFILLFLYTCMMALYISMVVFIITKKGDPLFGAGVQGSNGIADFTYGISVLSPIMSAIFVAGWIIMCIRYRAQAIGRYEVHPATNIFVEVLFLLTHVCLITSDRSFLSLLPDTFDVGSILYPLELSLVIGIAFMVIYLLGKMFGRYLCLSDDDKKVSS